MKYWNVAEMSRPTNLVLQMQGNMFVLSHHEFSFFKENYICDVKMMIPTNPVICHTPNVA